MNKVDKVTQAERKLSGLCIECGVHKDLATGPSAPLCCNYYKRPLLNPPLLDSICLHEKSWRRRVWKNQHG